METDAITQTRDVRSEPGPPNKIELVIRATNNFTKIISTKEIKTNYPELDWGQNGVGNRFANQKFNYSVIFRNKISRYSDNDNDEIPAELLHEFRTNNTSASSGIIGIFVHSIKTRDANFRPINAQIKKAVVKNACVVCGTTDTFCDHKNDLYNDMRVLNVNTQTIDDFQALCNHCNLQKRQVCKTEKQTKQIYSGKNIPQLKVWAFEFPWEKKAYDESDIDCKKDTYWYDPIEFMNKIQLYYPYYINVVVPLAKLP